MKVIGKQRARVNLPSPSNVLPMIRPGGVYEYDDNHARELIERGIVRRYSGTAKPIDMRWLVRFIQQEAV